MKQLSPIIRPNSQDNIDNKSNGAFIVTAAIIEVANRLSRILLWLPLPAFG